MGVHRTTSNSRLGRSMINVGVESRESNSPEVRQHNAEIEARKQAKKEKKAKKR